MSASIGKRPGRDLTSGSITSLALAAGNYRFGNWRSMRMIEDDRPTAGEPPDTGLGVPRERAGLGTKAAAQDQPPPSSRLYNL